MRRMFVCARFFSDLILTLRADRFLDFEQGARRLLENKEKLNDANRLHRPKFDLRAFHDEALANGALPMNILEMHIKEWVAQRKSA